MKILFIGDIVGSPGRKTVKSLLPSLKKDSKIDLVLANAENIASGRGVTRETLEEVLEAGVNFFTSGNHVWRFKEIYETLDDPSFPLIRPANYPEEAPGRGYEIFDLGKKGQVLVINLAGRVFLRDLIGSQYKVVDSILEKLKKEHFEAIIVDIHAEATSEKVALGFYLDGKVSAVCGTHTHIPTADQRILPGGTAYVTDIGMVGPLNSVLGQKTEIIIDTQRTQIPHKFEVEKEGPMIFQSVLIEIGKKGKAEKIERVDRVVEDL